MKSDKKRVLLLVEDDAILAMAEKAVLERYGFGVVVACDGEEAVRIVRDSPEISLVLMDIELGEDSINGTEAAGRILAVRDLPLIFLSSHTEREIVEKTEGITSYGYIVKDTGETVLIASIKMAYRLFDARRLAMEKEEEAREKHMLLSSIIENAGTIVFVKDRDGRYELINNEWERLTGQPYEKTIGHTDLEIFPGPVARQFRENDRVVMESGETLKFEEHLDSPEGRRHFLCIKFPLRNRGGGIRGICGMATDITSVLAAEDALRESELRLRNISDNVPGGYMYQIDSGENAESRRFLHLSAGAERIHGIRLADAMRDASLIYGQVAGEDAAVVARREEEAAKTMSPFNAEVRIRTPSGGIRWLHYSSAPRRMPDNHIIWDGIAIDITGRKQGEEHVRALLAEKDLLLKEVHHRIKNNIASIEGLLSLQMRSTEHPEVRHALQKCVTRASGMRILYEKLISPAHTREISTELYLGGLLEAIRTVFTDSLEPRGHALDARIDDFMASPRLAFSLGIIVNELATNSIKHAFAGSGSGAISVDLRKDGRHVALTVRDNGCGLPADFNPSVAKGLGMTLIRSFCRQMNASLRFENDGGTKATVEFDL